MPGTTHMILKITICNAQYCAKTIHPSHCPWTWRKMRIKEGQLCYLSCPHGWNRNIVQQLLHVKNDIIWHSKHGISVIWWHVKEEQMHVKWNCHTTTLKKQYVCFTTYNDIVWHVKKYNWILFILFYFIVSGIKM